MLRRKSAWETTNLARFLGKALMQRSVEQDTLNQDLSSQSNVLIGNKCKREERIVLKKSAKLLFLTIHVLSVVK